MSTKRIYFGNARSADFRLRLSAANPRPSGGRWLMLLFVAYNTGAAQPSQWWDNNGTSTPTGGTWDTTTPNWANSSALTASPVVFTAGNVANFAAGSSSISALTIMVNSAASCGGIYNGANGGA